jgi:hypothetical protein
MLLQLPRRAISECVWSECIHKRGCNLISRRRISLRFIPSQNNIRFLKTTKQYSVPKSSVLQHSVLLAEVGLVNRRGEEKEQGRRKRGKTANIRNFRSWQRRRQGRRRVGTRGGLKYDETLASLMVALNRRKRKVDWTCAFSHRPTLGRRL